MGLDTWIVAFPNRKSGVHFCWKRSSYLISTKSLPFAQFE